MKQTFLVEVIDQQNSSWQGTVKWLNTGNQKNFRSALELIRLLDSALTEENNQSDMEGGSDP